MSIVKLKSKSHYSHKVELLDELIPNIKRYMGETFVIYYNGQALYDKELAAKFAHDVVLLRQLGINVIIVHGGEKIVDEIHKKLNFDFTYVDNLKVTDSNSIKIVEMVLIGLVNKGIVMSINDAGGSAVGISGKDANLIEAKKYRSSRSHPNSNIKDIIDLGFVGEPTVINPDILLTLEDSEFIPVIAPVAVGENGETFQVNTLTTAAVISSSLAVQKFIIIDDCEDVISQLNCSDSISYDQLCAISQNVIDVEGKAWTKHLINTCICVLQNKVESINIINGKVPHSLLLDIFTSDRCGALIES